MLNCTFYLNVHITVKLHIILILIQQLVSDTRFTCKSCIYVSVIVSSMCARIHKATDKIIITVFNPSEQRK